MELIRDIDMRGISKVYIKEKVFFNRDDIKRYIDIFNELRDEGFIIASSYNDKKWKLPCKTTNEYIPLKYDIDIYQDIQEALKIYSLILIAKGKSAGWIRNVLDILKKVVLETNGFMQTLRLEKFLSSELRTYFIARTILNFTDFYSVPNIKEIKRICVGVQSDVRRTRELPPFLDIFIFDEIVNEYFRKTSMEEHLKYKPIQLWWAITNIIPMRPSDFLKLNKNCAWKDKKGRYWITLSRSKKVKQSVRDSPPLQTIQINKEIFDLINNFKLHLIQMGIESDFLLPQTFYKIINFSKTDRTRIVVEDRWIRDQFSSILKHFHTKVVKGIYEEKYTMEILPSHTRHLAIINLFLQGFNMLSIAKMAGHDELNSQSNYYSHAENFVDSFVYSLVKSGFSDRIGSKMGDGFIGWRRETIDRGKRYSYEEAQKIFYKVDYGYCKDIDDFPNNCGEDCRPCNFFIFKPSINEYEKGLKWLESYSQKIGIEIKNVVQTMISTSQALSSSNRPDLDESLKSKSRQLQQLMDHKALLEYKILEDHLNE